MHWRRGSEPDGHDDLTVRTIIASNVAIASALPPSDLEHLVRLTIELIEDKRWEPIGPIALDEEILVSIAANAAIPVLALGIGAYRNVRSILVHATTHRSTGLRSGPAPGVVTNTPITTVGQASSQSGPVSITWPTALADSHSPAGGTNVVIHEFAHKIDMLDGYSDGTPPLHGAALAAWSKLLDTEYGLLQPELKNDPLRPYAFSNPAEFFAVSTEAFFCTPRRLHAARPSLHAALADFYRLDPLDSWDLGDPGSG